MNESYIYYTRQRSFDAGAEMSVLHTYEKLQSNELDLILGASMMEPDIRIKTNEKGFCPRHYGMMFARNNKLQLALMLESHLDEIISSVKPGGFLTRDAAQKPVSYLGKLEESCYVCERIEASLGKMFETACILWAREKEFRDKFDAQTFFCLEHYKRLLESARSTLPSKTYSELICSASKLEGAYLSKLRGDISHFIKKFDYRYEDSRGATRRISRARYAPYERKDARLIIIRALRAFVCVIAELTVVARCCVRHSDLLLGEHTYIKRLGKLIGAAIMPICQHITPL